VSPVNPGGATTGRIEDMTNATADPTFEDRVQAALAGLPETTLVDRFRANDLLLDLMGSTDDPDEAARVLAALAALPRSGLLERAAVRSLLADLVRPNTN
jgi:hypothetical protein